MRLFIAFEIPDDISAILHKVQSELHIPGRATKTKSFHLTLKFLGEVDDNTIPKIKEALSQIKFEPFKASLSDIGAFPNTRNPRIVWIGLEPHDPINAIQKQVNQAVRAFAPEADNRFHPHLTLARIKFLNNKAQFQQSLESTTIPEANFKLKDFHLMKSNLTPQGPKYDILETFQSI